MTDISVTQQQQPLMFHKRCCVNIFIFGKVLKGGLMKRLINLASWVGYKQGEVNNACRQAWNHEVIETFSFFIHYSHRSCLVRSCKRKMWWDSTVPSPTGFLHFALSQVLYSLFSTSIQAAPGSYCSSSPILPTMFHLPHGPQPHTASLVDQSVPSLFHFLFFPLLSLMPVFNWPFTKVYLLPCLVIEVEGSARQLRDRRSCLCFRHLELHQGCFWLPSL